MILRFAPHLMACTLTAGVCIATGCSDAPRSIRTAKAIDSVAIDKPLELPTGTPPEKSDPVAAAIVAEAVKAHTNGKPERLDKLKRFKMVRTGILGGTQPQLWEYRGEWPDRFRVDEPQSQMSIVRVGQDGWVSSPAQGVRKNPLQEPYKRGVLADTMYEFLPVLIPLADPTLVAAPFADRTINGKPASGVWLSGKHLPRAVVHFDKESKRLVQCAFESYEGDATVIKEVTILEYREVNGVQIPEKLTIKWNGRPAAEWTVTSIEFPVDLPAKVFEEP